MKYLPMGEEKEGSKENLFLCRLCSFYLMNIEVLSFSLNITALLTL